MTGSGQSPYTRTETRTYDRRQRHKPERQLGSRPNPLGRLVFSEEAVLCIREATGGVPRRINILAEHCLEVACNGKSTLVDGGTVQAAVKICVEALR